LPAHTPLLFVVGGGVCPAVGGGVGEPPVPVVVGGGVGEPPVPEAFVGVGVAPMAISATRAKMVRIFGHEVIVA
jgi:hypothetical protein